MDRLHTSMNTYIKSMSHRREGEDKEKMLPLDMLAQSMISHGEEFEAESLFGTCLISKAPALLSRSLKLTTGYNSDGSGE